MATINCYLSFTNKCEEAFNFYKSVFGGEFTSFSKFKDMPPSDEFKLTENDMEKIMHVSLPISKETVLMGSDMADCKVDFYKKGNNFSLSINAETKDETSKLFNALADGGQITMPLMDTFWDAYFGMLTDKFGIQWMVNCQVKK